MEAPDDGDEVVPSTATSAAAPPPLPKCFCNWKNCRTYQKALREYKHAVFNGVVKLKFVQDNPKSMALKASIDRTLHVEASKKNDWKPAAGAAGGSTKDDDDGLPSGSSPTCRYYVARHHFTEALIMEYLQDRRAWDWNEPLSMKQAKTCLWSLDRMDVYKDDDDVEDGSDDNDNGDDSEDRYVQAPNVPKEQVKEIVRKAKEDYKRSLQQPQPATPTTSAPSPPVKQQSLRVTTAPKKNNTSSSGHTQSTQATTVADSVNQTLSPQPEPSASINPSTPAGASTAAAAVPPPDLSSVVLVEKEQENLRLRQELNECQNQLTMLHSIVKELQINMIKPQQVVVGASSAVAALPVPINAATSAKGNATAPSRQRNTHNNTSTRKKERGTTESSSEEEDEDSSSEEEEDDEEDEEDEDGDWSNGRLPEGGRAGSDDDETISTFHINGAGGSGSGHSARILSNPATAQASATVRRNSVHSRRSIRGRDSRRSTTGSATTNSIPGGSHRSVRRDSIHSRRSMVRGGGGGGDDGASVVSRQSLQSISPSIKSLPREIELMDDEDDDVDDEDVKDDYSFFDDSYRKPDDDARSVGSRSAASRASRRSIVSGARSRGRKNSRRPGANGGSGSSSNAKNKIPPQTPSTGAARSRNGVVPREIDVSGDELEDETYANVSTDTLFVTDKQIVDPYGEKGVYTGALSKSTGMPNGKGRLEYEKEGRWYEGDWIHGRWTGFGRLSNGDGDFYEGGLKNDHKHGTGVMRFADGRVFEGEYIRGQMIQGKMTYQDGSVYGGSWVDGMRHGRGKCIFVDGSEYEGEFREGNFHGQGQMTWNDGGWYVGEWCEGEMHGKGKEIRPDGSLRHDGEWSRGQPIRSATDSRRRRAAASQQHSHVPAN